VYLALGIRPDGRREVLGFWLFGAEGESATNWRQVVRELWERGVREVKLFISDDLPGIEEAVREIFPSAKWQLCVLHTVRGTLAKVRKADREALAQDLKAIYRADTVKQAHRALRALECRTPKPSGPTFTPRTSWRMTAELKRRTKVVEVFCGPEALEKLVYLVLAQENERLLGRRLRGFAEMQLESCHAPGHTC